MLRSFNGISLMPLPDITQATLSFVLLYGLIMGFGYLFYWYRSMLGFILTSVIYVLIYAGVWLGMFVLFRRDEKLISDALDRIRDEE